MGMSPAGGAIGDPPGLRAGPGGPAKPGRRRASGSPGRSHGWAVCLDRIKGMDRIGTAWEEDGGTPLELTCRVFAQCVAVSRSMGGIVRPADRVGLTARPAVSTGLRGWTGLGAAWEEDGGPTLELTRQVFVQCVAVSRSMAASCVRQTGQVSRLGRPHRQDRSVGWMHVDYR